MRTIRNVLSSRHVPGAVLGLLIVLGATAAGAAPSMTIVLKLVQRNGTTLPGDSTIAGHVGEIIVTSFTFNDHVVSTGQSQCGDLTFFKSVDSSSPKLLLDSLLLDNFQTATFYFLDTSTKTPDLVFTIVLSPASIDSYTVSANSGPVKATPAPTEQVSLQFRQISFTDAASDTTTGWDCVTNRAI